MKSLSMTIQMKGTASVILFIMLYNVTLTFDFADKILLFKLRPYSETLL